MRLCCYARCVCAALRCNMLSLSSYYTCRLVVIVLEERFDVIHVHNRSDGGGHDEDRVAAQCGVRDGARRLCRRGDGRMDGGCGELLGLRGWGGGGRRRSAGRSAPLPDACPPPPSFRAARLASFSCMSSICLFRFLKPSRMFSMIGNDLAVGASKLLFLSRIFTSRRTIACVISRSCRMNGFAFAITSFSVSASLPSSPSSGGPTPTPFANSRLKAFRPASTAACPPPSALSAACRRACCCSRRRRPASPPTRPPTRPRSPARPARTECNRWRRRPARRPACTRGASYDP